MTRIHESKQILVLEDPPYAQECSSCRAPVERLIRSGVRLAGVGSDVLALCNMCLSILRELIAEHEATPPVARKVLRICTACGHMRDYHTAYIRGPACTKCGTCPGYVGP